MDYWLFLMIHKGLLIALMCLSGQILASPVGAPGCYYNGQFRIGNWTDGCDFSCSCEDPEIGHYRCVVRQA
ncbi:hypothetical protein DPMN_008587 [Dreissena polymorpha]|uniref:Uncharacterized protein n=1 Tax=Dreissena polymorpha TaxID=45954 RepID=A0A9D4MZL7_DREPO|nr:hypothetical protein DPMN_008587 [Dreissena polymorpha]